jgi:hypothetical protein
MKRCLVFLLALCCSFAAAKADPVPLDWDPAHTWLFVVGVLEWKDSESFDPFPVKLRRDTELVDLFKAKGVPASQIVYLQDKQATQQRIESAFISQLKKIPEGDLLVVYYAGHGYKSDNGKDVYLAPYDAGDDSAPGWSVKSIPRTIEKYSSVSQVLWLIDCCYSGRAAVEIKGRTTGPGYLCVTSSLASQSSTGHWTFTEAFLDAMRGASYVDINHDGKVSIDEFARHVELDMSQAEEQQSAFATSGPFDTYMTLAAAQPQTNSQIGERVKLQDNGKWYTARIVDAKDGQFKAHYIGYSEDDDIWVKPSDMRPVTPTEYAVGSKVEVLWKKEWYPATILKVKDGVHYIHYTDYGDDWDEWVSSKRIRVGKK